LAQGGQLNAFFFPQPTSIWLSSQPNGIIPEQIAQCGPVIRILEPANASLHSELNKDAVIL
jgi:hypothetical protein